MSESSTGPRAEVREIRDPQVLRAMAHPARLRILEELATAGAATATELSGRIGESAANCSWHLRQLAKYGFIEEAAGGTGRQRPWRLVVRSTRVPAASDDEPDLARASDALLEVLLGREVAAFRAWQAARYSAPKAWREASFARQSWDYLTAEELAELRRELGAVVERFLMSTAGRADPARRPPGTQLVRFVVWAFPATVPAEEPAATDHPGREGTDAG
jgi:DNA-binding transcriptional ArsR family regulator